LQGRPNVVSRAQAVAEAATTIDALRHALAQFSDCPLAATATNLVFADGNPQSGLVLIGEAPGAEEDLAGRPFVGASGQLLDRMLASVGLSRTTDLLITNLIPWRPPGNRPPTETEIHTCLPFLLRHLTLLRPRLIVTLGALSTRTLTGRDEGIRRQRGRWQSVAVPGLPQQIPTLPMLHPAYLLRTPGAKKDAWTDLITLRRRLDEK
jgi:DNA polymerase